MHWRILGNDFVPWRTSGEGWEAGEGNLDDESGESETEEETDLDAAGEDAETMRQGVIIPFRSDAADVDDTDTFPDLQHEREMILRS